MGSIEKPQPLLSLPLELLIPIISKLSNRDLKALRLTCSTLRNLAPLRIECAYILLKWRDIRVFRALADYRIYRYIVTETIVDDGVLRLCRLLQGEDAMGIPNWFVTGHEGNIREVESFKPCFVILSRQGFYLKV
jgi:hypothetical protein